MPQDQPLPPWPCEVHGHPQSPHFSPSLDRGPMQGPLPGQQLLDTAPDTGGRSLGQPTPHSPSHPLPCTRGPRTCAALGPTSSSHRRGPLCQTREFFSLTLGAAPTPALAVRTGPYVCHGASPCGSNRRSPLREKQPCPQRREAVHCRPRSGPCRPFPLCGGCVLTCLSSDQQPHTCTVTSCLALEQPVVFSFVLHLSWPPWPTLLSSLLSPWAPSPGVSPLNP